MTRPKQGIHASARMLANPVRKLTSYSSLSCSTGGDFQNPIRFAGHPYDDVRGRNDTTIRIAGRQNEGSHPTPDRADSPAARSYKARPCGELITRPDREANRPQSLLQIPAGDLSPASTRKIAFNPNSVVEQTLQRGHAQPFRRQIRAAYPSNTLPGWGSPTRAKKAAELRECRLLSSAVGATSHLAAGELLDVRGLSDDSFRSTFTSFLTFPLSSPPHSPLLTMPPSLLRRMDFQRRSRSGLEGFAAPVRKLCRSLSSARR